MCVTARTELLTPRPKPFAFLHAHYQVPVAMQPETVGMVKWTPVMSPDPPTPGFPAYPRHGVDLVISGHVHAYERSHPVYKYKLVRVILSDEVVVVVVMLAVKCMGWWNMERHFAIWKA
jgi:hypothetical protein